jgi:dihydroorotate dehydrogenase (fumarate)
MNAAGTCKNLEDVKKLSRSATSAIVVGSITMEARPGNEGNVYWSTPDYALNSLGLPNPGQSYYKQNLPQMSRISHDAGKPLFVSVAGFEPKEYARLSELAFEGGADLMELNLGCPNVWVGNTQKQIASYDSSLIDEILSLVESAVGEGAIISVKLSPFSDPQERVEAVLIIKSYRMVKSVTAINTFPNALEYNGLKPAITFGSGLAGLSGPALRPIALGEVQQLRPLLPDSTQIIGVGGITRGSDIWKFLNLGASAVQIATRYLDKGERIFSDLLEDLVLFQEAYL